MNACVGFFSGCLMEVTKEGMLQHAWFEVEFLGMIGNTYFSRLGVPVYSYIAL